MTLQFERKFTITLLFVFLILTTVGISLYQTTVSTQQAIVWEKRNQEISSTLDGALALTLDTDSGVDSFVITGNDSYLEPYNNLRQQLSQSFSRVRLLTAAPDAIGRELSTLDRQLNEHIARMAEKIALRKSVGFETAVAELAKSDDRAAINGIRQSIERAKAIETSQLQAREQSLERSLSRTVWILILSCLAGIASLAFANFVVFRETSKRAAAEKALVEANRDLEARITERTSELTRANAELKAAGDERASLLKNERSARREAEIANRLRDEFMATVSHELKTPLNSMLGWARLLRGGKLSSDQTDRAIDIIIKNSELQNRLIEDLLDVARVISGKLELDCELFDAAALCEGAIDAMKPAADARQIAIRFENRATAPPSVYGDKNRLKQVVLNLLTNAVKFSPDNSLISVCTDIAGASHIAITVADQGIGIKEEFLPLVFERFRQDESAAGSGGLGLGLAIVRNLVEMHGGEVSVSSDGEGLGTTFRVLFPLAAKTDAKAAVL